MGGTSVPNCLSPNGQPAENSRWKRPLRIYPTSPSWTRLKLWIGAGSLVVAFNRTGYTRGLEEKQSNEPHGVPMIKLRHLPNIGRSQVPVRRVSTHSLYIFHPGRLGGMAGFRKRRWEGKYGQSLMIPRYKYMLVIGLSTPVSARTEAQCEYTGCMLLATSMLNTGIALILHIRAVLRWHIWGVIGR